MKVGDWAMLKLHKGSLILFFVGITKKLTQQYIGFFQIIERVGCLIYKLNISSNWKIYPVFSIAQLKLAPNPTKDPF